MTEDLDVFLQVYVFLKGEATEDDLPVDMNYKILRDYAQKLAEDKERAKYVLDKFKPVDKNSVKWGVRNSVSVYNAFLEEAEQKVYEVTCKVSDRVTACIHQLVTFLSQNEEYNVRASVFVSDMDGEIETHKELKRVTWIRDALAAKRMRIVRANQKPDMLQLVKAGFSKIVFDYEEDLNWVKPSLFDALLAVYIVTSEYAPMIEPIVESIIKGTIDSALITIASFAELLREEITSSTMPYHQYIIYLSLIRFLFDEAYVRKSELNACKSANALFLTNCDTFRSQMIHELALPARVKKQYAKRMTVRTIFKEKLAEMLNGLEYMTNPIDIVTVLSKAHNYIAKTFSESHEPLKFEETTTLMLSLISVNPPSNAVSLARFMHKWKSLTLFKSSEQTRYLFVAAIQKIYSFSEDGENQEEEETAAEKK